MASGLRIASAQRQDLVAVAALHARAFPDAAMTAFGPEAQRCHYLVVARWSARCRADVGVAR